MKKILHISDTHSYHGLLTIPEGIDIIVHSGDFSNYYDVYKNEPEALNFLHWYGSLNIKHKILIAGNHDAYASLRTTELREWCKHYDIIYLENESVVIEGFKFYGSPITPTFGNWYFMKARDKTDDIWKNIPDDTDILITHGPPKGILDLSYNRENKLEFCGDKSLRNHVLNRIKPKLMLFGHIHSHKDIDNQGRLELSGYPGIIFSNGSVVEDGKFGVLTNNGNIFEL